MVAIVYVSVACFRPSDTYAVVDGIVAYFRPRYTCAVVDGSVAYFRPRDTDAVVDGSVAYFRPRDTKQIHRFDSISEKWSSLPDCLCDHTTLTIVNSLLTAVGGEMNNTSTNQIQSLKGEGSKRKWSQIFPPMPTSRSHTVVVNTSSALVVAGGWAKKRFTKGGPLTSVEVMNTSSLEWYTAAELPVPVFSASATTCLDRIYILRNGSNLQCNVPALIATTYPQVFPTQQTHSPTTNQTEVWFNKAPLPLGISACYTFNNHVYAFVNDTALAQKQIYLYDQDYNTWQHIDTLKDIPRDCSAVILPPNVLMVVGGQRVLFTYLIRLQPRQFVTYQNE